MHLHASADYLTRQANAHYNLLRVTDDHILHANSNGMTALLYAIKESDIEIAKQHLLPRIIDEHLTHADNKGNTALIYAAKRGDAELVESLIVRMPSHWRHNNDGMSPLSAALKYRNTNVMKVIMRR
jgi:ankyrin repeat protein